MCWASATSAEPPSTPRSFQAASRIKTRSPRLRCDLWVFKQSWPGFMNMSSLLSASQPRALPARIDLKKQVLNGFLGKVKNSTASDNQALWLYFPEIFRFPLFSSPVFMVTLNAVFFFFSSKNPCICVCVCDGLRSFLRAVLPLEGTPATPSVPIRGWPAFAMRPLPLGAGWSLSPHPARVLSCCCPAPAAFLWALQGPRNAAGAFWPLLFSPPWRHNTLQCVIWGI